ncbi:MAG: S8 family serine peptidase, partial [Candidatus Sulfomarinibacteraceae bacterium]
LSPSVRALVSADDPLKVAADRGFAVRDHRVQVVVLATEASVEGLERWLTDRGARFVFAYGDRIQAFVPPELLPELEGRTDVVEVERPLYAQLPEPAPPAAAARPKLLAVTSEGVEPINVPAWHAEGFAGEGLKIGVIDVEFGGWDDLLGVELPPAGRTTYRAFGGSSVAADQVHGTACAEIVHDVAPDADLYLAHIRTLGDFYASLDWLTTVGVDVVTMSVGWFGAGPGDGTGSSADRVNAFVAAADALFFTSAGNERRSHWQGPSTDADADGWVDFEPGDNLNELVSTMAVDDRVAVSMVWSDWDSPSSNYSLHLFRLDGTEWVEVAVSDRPQTGLSHQTPYEQISHTTPDGGLFAVRIGRNGVVGTHDVELFSADSDLVNRVASGSLTIPADAQRVMAVAAVNYNSPYTVRSFSSAGPTNGPGGTIAGGTTKPDLSGFDGVSTVSYGTRNFFGTSAASPHAAAAAALVRQAEPGMTADQVQTFLESRAQDLGTSGMDNDYGWGRVFLGQTPGSNCTFAIDPTSVTEPASGGGGIVRLTTADGCPWSTSSRVDWITVAPPNGTGSKVIGYTVDANPGPARTGEVIIADLVFTVSQAGSGCSYALSPTTETFSAAGGAGSFAVDVDAGCAWAAVSGDAWITVTSGSGSGSGPGEVSYSVDANGGQEQRSGSILVGDAVFTVVQTAEGGGLTTMVAGIAETAGAAQTRWRSDLAILNRGTAAAHVDLEYRWGEGSADASLTVGPGSVVELVNVAADTFGAPDTAGAVEVVSDAPVIVTARTYNAAQEGTFGQSLPGVTADDGLGAGETAVLSQLGNNDAVRTNVGFVDLGGNGALARIRLFDGDGRAVGSELGEIVPAGGWAQVNRVFRQANAGQCSGCYALIDLIGGDGPVWAYASVVDNLSGDPTTIPMAPIAQAKADGDLRYMVAGIAETGGANQTRWKSNLALVNLSGGAATADLIYRFDGGSETSTVTLADGELREFANAAADLFATPNSAGAVDVAADGSLVVTARTFNDSPDGTFGQFLPGLDASAALTPGDDGYLSQLKSTDEFRTNIGFTNYGGSDCTVRVFLHDEDGVRKGQLHATVPASGWTQVNRVFESAGVGSCPLGYALVEVLTGGCEVWAYASVVDNGSGDPTTVPVVAE